MKALFLSAFTFRFHSAKFLQPYKENISISFHLFIVILATSYTYYIVYLPNLSYVNFLI